MADGVQQVEKVLGKTSHISRDVIEDTLWYYYFDVEQTIDYLREEAKSGTKSIADDPLPLSTQMGTQSKPNPTTMSKLTEASSKLSLNDITSRLSLQSSSLSSATKKLATDATKNDKPLLSLGSNSLSKSTIKPGFVTNLSGKPGSALHTLKPIAPLTSTLSKCSAPGLQSQSLSNSLKHSSSISLRDLGTNSGQAAAKEPAHRNIISSALSALSQLPTTGDKPAKNTSSKLNITRTAPIKPLSTRDSSNMASLTPKKTLKEMTDSNRSKLQSANPATPPSDEISPNDTTTMEASLHKSNLVASPSVFAISVFENLDQEHERASFSAKDDCKFFYSIQSEHLPKLVKPFKFDSPSPDDIVLVAQSHRSGGKLEVK
ncbi:hypothetical protein K493DRAFT_306954 [Basidiobolus meristosporus CBS 931.73]|uniref:HBS1-like protein N-terminal domain-containing protein n=1 Tax=Basidiobolus meristosporus CBS 931.73 TaxID=1314790 RepID=A0A1Y1XP32_9FUNG|nr:hypothetical protein K493DRAFT_306954 [Basidiobolus meristosporus CBS 931.73]|eukprot:ORX87084.1 hypothetical protein K493DRAFT_306954 [Basidiobolus meristosporus CBS 931.73]